MYDTWRTALAATLALGTLLTRPAAAQELIQNGGFESGTLAGWTTQDQAGSDGTFLVHTDGTINANPFRPAQGPASGMYYAVTDENGNGSHALLQSFTVSGRVSSAILSFDMFVDNYADASATPSTLDYTSAIANQQARVDLLTGSASAFDVGSSVLGNFYDGTDPNPTGDPLSDNPHDYTHRVFDITNLVAGGGTFQLRFAAVNNQDTLYQGVDNVSIFATAAPVPEVSSVTSFGVLLLLGAGGVILKARKRTA